MHPPPRHQSTPEPTLPPLLPQPRSLAGTRGSARRLPLFLRPRSGGPAEAREEHSSRRREQCEHMYVHECIYRAAVARSRRPATVSPLPYSLSLSLSPFHPLSEVVGSAPSWHGSALFRSWGGGSPCCRGGHPPPGGLQCPLPVSMAAGTGYCLFLVAGSLVVLNFQDGLYDEDLANFHERSYADDWFDSEIMDVRVGSRLDQNWCSSKNLPSCSVLDICTRSAQAKNCAEARIHPGCSCILNLFLANPIPIPILVPSVNPHLISNGSVLLDQGRRWRWRPASSTFSPPPHPHATIPGSRHCSCLLFELFC